MKRINYISEYGLFVFAYDPQAVPTANTGSSNLAPGMAEFYSKRMLERTLPNLVYHQFGEKETITENAGKTINWRRFLSYQPADVLQEGITPDPSNPVQEKISVTVIQLGAFTPFTDLVSMTHIDLRITELVDLHSEQAALTVDKQVRDELCTSTNIIYAPIVADDGSKTTVTSRASITANAKLTPEVIAQASTFLRKQNAPTIDGTHYAMIVHPSVAHDIMTNKDWIDYQKYANPDNIYKGEIGTLYGFRFFLSTQARVTKDGASKAAVYDCISLGKNAFKVCDIAGKGIEIIVKPITSGGSDNPLNQRGSVAWKLAAFACKITYPGRICHVVCGSSFSGIDAENA